MKPHGKRHPPVLIVTVIFLVAFVSGYATCMDLHRGADADAHVRIMVEEAIRQGILVVDHERGATLEKRYDHGNH